MVANNRVGITTTTQAVTTKGISAAADGTTIEDVYATNSNIVEVNTFKPAYTLGSGVSTKTAITDTNNGAVGLVPNTISKVRVYVWLEGQDPDCVDLASTGDKLNINLKLIKDPYIEGVGGNSYDGAGGAGGGAGSEPEPDESEYITAASLAALSEDEAKLHYGGYVTNYTARDHTNEELGIGGWRIFHSDGSNIYLIADNYVNLTKEVDGETVNIVPNDTSLWEDGNIPPRGFSLDIGSSGYTSDDISSTIGNKWLNQYYTSLNGLTDETDEISATGYLLDTNIWAGFANSSYASYAVGGPTIELFRDSYNRTQERDIETQVIYNGDPIYYYQMRMAGGTFGDTLNLNTSDKLYVLENTDYADGMWIASPGFTQVLLVYHDGYIQYTLWGDSSDGARPIICLNGSIKLEKTGEGQYQIVE